MPLHSLARRHTQSARPCVAWAALVLYVLSMAGTWAVPRGASQLSATHCFCQAHEVVEAAERGGTPQWRHRVVVRSAAPAPVCVLCSRERDEQDATSAATSLAALLTPTAHRLPVVADVAPFTRDLHLLAPSHSPPA